MNTIIFFYKFIYFLYTYDIKKITREDLTYIHALFLSVLDSYKLNKYSAFFEKEKKFSWLFIYVFTSFELGTFINHELEFESSPIFIPSLLEHPLSVSDKQIKEISFLISIDLKQRKK